MTQIPQEQTRIAQITRISLIKGRTRTTRIMLIWSADTIRPSTLPAYIAARRTGPGRRRRAQGRSDAQGLDAAEHGDTIA